MPRTENSSEYIIEKVAPLFNSKGYVGTSLSDLTKVTGMTKGALYCNFDNKEDIALAAFKYNVYQGFQGNEFRSPGLRNCI